MRNTGIIKLYNEGGEKIYQLPYYTKLARRNIFNNWYNLARKGSYIQISIGECSPKKRVHQKEVIPDKPKEPIKRFPPKYDNDNKSLYDG